MNAIDAASGVKSLSIAPLTIKEFCPVGPPVPALVLMAEDAHYWQTSAVSCRGRGWSDCGGDQGTSICVRDGDAPTPEFKLCIHQDDDLPKSQYKFACPSDWPELHVLYDDAEDKRKCTDCTCTPVGSLCDAVISVYTDNACQTIPDTNNVTLNPDFCINLAPPGQALGSKSAGHPTYIPGTCQPMGSEPIDGGTIEAVGPKTWCCKP
jgi:hypothetical protein